jgi:UDP-2,4-diacetamido-2,4,6-trideoxy-beta-L-altropyranose hydrolase
MGHVIRCLSLAHALREAGANVFFLMRELGGGSSMKVREFGFEVIALSGPESSDGVLPEWDRLRTAEVARELRAGWVLVDHYGAGEGYLEGLRSEGLHIAVLDDMADRSLTACSWLLNQNLGAETLPYRTTGECVRLLGPEFALLRPEFHAARQVICREFSRQDTHVLLTLGGGQTCELSLEVIRALDAVSPRIEIRCILGGADPVPNTLRHAAESSGHEVSILQDETDMASHMLWADLSINAGGSTCWELCCLGVPMVSLVRSKDQSMIARALDEVGCSRNLGEWNPGQTGARLAETVRELFGNPDKRSEMSRTGRLRVDGLGAKRAADSLLDLMKKGETGIG